jgi:hypothetical protein
MPLALRAPCPRIPRTPPTGGTSGNAAPGPSLTAPRPDNVTRAPVSVNVCSRPPGPTRARDGHPDRGAAEEEPGEREPLFGPGAIQGRVRKHGQLLEGLERRRAGRQARTLEVDHLPAFSPGIGVGP